jgi:hypothetical protein
MKQLIALAFIVCLLFQLSSATYDPVADMDEQYNLNDLRAKRFHLSQVRFRQK